MRTAVATTAAGRGAIAGALVSTWRGRIALAVLAAMTIAGIYRVAGAPGAATYRTQPVARGTVTQTVLVVGAIDTTAALKLSFKTSGKIAKIMTAVGETVPAGRALAQLDTGDLQISLSGAKANVASAQARYDQTLAGASAEDVALARNAVDSAQRSLDLAQTSTQNDVRAAQQALDNAKAALDRTRQSGAADVESARVNVDRVRNAYTSARTSFATYVARINNDLAAYLAAIDSAKKQTTDAFGLAGDPALNADVQPSLNSAIVSLNSAETSAWGPVQDALREVIADADAVSAAANLWDGAVASSGDVSSAVRQYQAAQTRYQTDATRLSVAMDGPAGLVASAATAVTTANNALNTIYRAGNAKYDDARIAVGSLALAMTADAQLAATIKTEVGQAGAALLIIGDAVGGSIVSAQQALAATQARVDGAVSAAESAVTSAQRAYASAQDRAASQVTTQQSALRSAQLALEKTNAGARATDIAAAYAGVLAAQSAADRATADLGNATLTAPAAGVVTAVNAHEGEQVGGAALTPIVVLQPTSAATLRGNVGEADIAKIKVGQAAAVAIEAAGGTVRGRVTSVDPSATLQQGIATYSVEVTVEGSGAAAPGMTATASVEVAKKSDVLTVPAAAVRARDGKRVIFVIDGSVPVATEITTGISDDALVEVTSGVREGQVVVVSEAAPPQTGAARLSANAPFSYAVPGDPTVERIAVVVQATNRSADDLVVNVNDLLLRDGDHRIYPSDAQAAAADARIVRAIAAIRGTPGVRPLAALTLRKDDVVVGFVVFSVPAGTRPAQLVFRQTDADVVVDLVAR